MDIDEFHGTYRTLKNNFQEILANGEQYSHTGLPRFNILLLYLLLEIEQYKESWAKGEIDNFDAKFVLES